GVEQRLLVPEALLGQLSELERLEVDALAGGDNEGHILAQDVAGEAGEVLLSALGAGAIGRIRVGAVAVAPVLGKLIGRPGPGVEPPPALAGDAQAVEGRRRRPEADGAALDGVRRMVSLLESN